jgi:hypothetical protein
MARQTLIKNYNDLSGCVVTDLNKLKGAPENAVKDAINFEFSPTEGASVRKALDLESGIAPGSNGYGQLDSTLALGESKVQAFTFKGVLDQLASPSHDVVLNAFDGTGIAYELGADAQLADAQRGASVTGNDVLDGSWTSIAWSPSLGIYAAVQSGGIGGEIIISSDGVYWSYPAGTATGLGAFTSITWSETLGRFVAVGNNHYHYTSTDGVNWDKYYTARVGFTSVIWAETLGLFVAISSSDSTARCQTSPDGITWTDRVIDLNKNWQSVAWSPSLGLLVAVANGGTATQRVATSPDGVTWTLRTTPATDRAWLSVAFSDSLGQFVAVGNTDYVMVSTDGTTWAESVAFSEATYHEQVIWISELAKYVVVADTGGTYSAAASTDGTTWTEYTMPGTTPRPWAVSWSPELEQLLALSITSPGAVLTSPTGVTWTESTVASSINENPQDWLSFQGMPIGTIGATELGVMYNTAYNTYKLTTTIGLGKGALVRDLEGVYESIDLDYNPSAQVFTTASYTGTAFTSGEDLLVTLSGITRKYRMIKLTAGGGSPSAGVFTVDKHLGDTYTNFDGADTTSLVGATIVGLTSGASTTLASVTGEGLSDAHRYNLINQGWTQTYMDSYASSKTKWPNNTQVWFSGRDASNNFSPTELDKVSFGNTRAPQGHVLLNPFREWRAASVPGVWVGSVPNSTYSRGFTTIATFGSRVALSGANIAGAENTVFISPVISSKIATVNTPTIADLNFSDILAFYQKNDPTADIQNELLPDDGVVVPIAEAGRIYKVIAFHNSLLAFSDNGVWAIAGIDPKTGFTTDAFSVYRIEGAAGTSYPRTVVSTQAGAFYWSDDGLYSIGLSDRGDLIAANVSSNRIEGLYSPIQPANKAAALGYYDNKNAKVYWAYNTATDATYPELRNGLLVLDLKLNGFYPLKLPVDFADSGGDLSTKLFSINGFTQDVAYPDDTGKTPLKLIIGEHYNISGVAGIKHSIMEFNNSGTDFYDFSEYRSYVHSLTDLITQPEAYIDSWDDTLGDTTRKKQGIWVFVHMTKTETGFTDLGGGALAPVGESSLFMQARWDWNNSSAGGRWSTAREVYRHSRPYIPVDASDTYDTGESVITTKNKIYGRGRALSIRWTAQAGKDAVLLGYAVPYSVDAAP